MRRSPRPFVLTTLGLAALAMTVPAIAVGTDPGLSQQWGLRQIGAPAAWSTSVGAGVPIAVIDTGIEKGHEDLKDQLLAAVTCVGTDGDPARCKADGADIDGHGSHVAGIAAAGSNNVGIAGVAPGARIVAVRVFSVDPITGEPGAESPDIEAALRWVVANVPRKGVINMSLGGALPVKILGKGYEGAVEQAWDAGWLPVLTAGNDPSLGGLSSEQYGNLDALVVGATGPDGELAAYSAAFGNAKWGLVAPGGNARSGNNQGACQNEPAKCVLSTYKGGEYGLLQGTSMAAPHVAGAAALVMAAGLDNAATVQRLLATTNKDQDCGAGCKGRLDVAAAVAGLAPAAGTGGGAATTEAPGTVAPTATAPPTTRRTATTRPAAAPADVTAPAPIEAAASTEVPVETTGPAAITGGDDGQDEAVVGLTIEQAAGVADRDDEDGIPIGWALAAFAAVAGAAGTALLAWRRRWGASLP